MSASLEQSMLVRANSLQCFDDEVREVLVEAMVRVRGKIRDQIWAWHVGNNILHPAPIYRDGDVGRHRVVQGFVRLHNRQAERCTTAAH